MKFWEIQGRMAEEGFAELPFSPAVSKAMNTARKAGRKISARSWSTEISRKEHLTFGTGATSDTDKEAEAFIIETLRNEFPHSVCVGEESAKELDPETILCAPLAFFIDPRDGTTEDSHELPFWCVSIGVMERGFLTGGAVFAPEVRGGLTIVAGKGAGVYLSERNDCLLPIEKAVHVPEAANPVIHLGLDVQRLSTYHRFVPALPKELKPRGISPSGALGLALVAAGRIDAIVQSPQMPWDFAASMAMTLERGLVVRTGRIEGASVRPVALYDPENFRTDKQTLMFVAGKATFVEPLFDLLVNNYGD